MLIGCRDGDVQSECYEQQCRCESGQRLDSHNLASLVGYGWGRAVQFLWPHLRRKSREFLRFPTRGSRARRSSMGLEKSTYRKLGEKYLVSSQEITCPVSVNQDFGIFASFAGFVDKSDRGHYLLQYWFRNPKTSSAQTSDPK